ALRSGTPLQQRVTEVVARFWSRTLLALFAVAAVWRFLYLDRLSNSALANSMFDDARIYWAWSERIAQGHLIGANPFFLAPLYPYVLGLMRAFGVSSPSSVLFLQSLWGAGAAVLLADAISRLTTPMIGLGLGLILSVYQMAVFFDGLILTESLLFL